MKIFSASLPLVAVLLAIVPTAHAQALMGIDLGSNTVKVATIKNSEFAIVLNEASQRKTVNALGFDGDVRIFGEGASNLRGRLPKNVMLQAHHLLGVKAGSPVTEKFGKFDMPVPLTTDAQRGSPQFNPAGTPPLSPEEVVGMSVHYMSEMTKAYGKHAEVKSCVITVPPHFTQEARAALTSAADIAGVRILSVVNDNAAVAVRYAQERAADAKDEKVLFVDVGAAFTSASVAEYTKVKGVPRVTVKAVAYDDSLGGRQFDVRLAEYLADEFDKQTGFKIRENLKAYTKLLNAAGKAKMQLSANEMTLVSIGSLMNDKDFSLKVERKQLDELCKDLYAKIATPVKQVLAATGLAVTAFDHVVPFGGGWRIPGLQQVLQEELAITKLDTIINSDEAAAFGAVFMHGNSSGLLRVKEIVLVDETSPPKAEDPPTKLMGAPLGQAKNRHEKLCEEEELRQKKEAAKSALEAWIYGIKEKVMEDEMETVATEDEIAAIKKVLEEGEDWIYDEGETAEFATYQAKRQEINGKVEGPILRYDELSARPPALEAAKARAAKALSSAKSWAETRPQIPASETTKLQRLATELEKTVREGEAKLTGEGLKGPLPFTAEELTKKDQGIKDLMDALMLIKPKENKEL